MQAEIRTFAEVWPPDDTEESVVGTDFHQMTIGNLRLGINEIARQRQEHGRSVPWQALSQIVLVGCRRPDGSEYHTLPDVFVYSHTVDRHRPWISIATDGPPVLIIEVLSISTYRADLDLNRGKGYSYGRAGVREYLALDPTGAFLAERARAWRLLEGRYVPWEPDELGRWRSNEIDVAIGFEDELATVYTLEGEPLPHEGEYYREIARRDAELAERDAEIERLRRLLRERGYEDANE